MIERMRARRVLATTVAGLLLAVAAGPSTIAAFYCNQMGTTLAHPCCDQVVAQRGPVDGVDRLAPERCCSSTEVTLESSPGETAPKAKPSSVPTATAKMVFAGTARTVSLSESARALSALAGSGTPVLRLVCSLLI